MSDTDAPEVAESSESPAPVSNVEDWRPSRILTVAVTGGTGFVGRHFCDRLAEHGHRIRALVRTPSKSGILPQSAERFEGDLFDESSMLEFLDGVDACVHLVGIIFENRRREITFDRVHVEATRSVVKACQTANVKRYVHMSALGTRPGALARYHQTKFEAEKIVRASELDWTIFRPSLIHGPNGEFTEMIKRWVRGTAPPFLFMPYFGSGPMGFGPKFLIQPVYVQDVAEAFARSVGMDETVGEVFPMGGPDQMTWPQMLLSFREAILGSRGWRPAFPMPSWKAAAIAKTANALGVAGLVPFNEDQVIMSQEHSTCQIDRVETYLKMRMTPFHDALDEYAGSLASARAFPK